MWSGDGLGFVNQFGSAGVLQTNITIPAAGPVSTNLATQITTPPGASVSYATNSSGVCSVSGSTMTSIGNGDCVVTITTSEVAACMTCEPKVYPVAASTTNVTLKLTGQVVVESSPLSAPQQQQVTEMGVTGVTDPRTTPVNTESVVLDLTKGAGILLTRLIKPRLIASDTTVTTQPKLRSQEAWPT